MVEQLEKNLTSSQLIQDEDVSDIPTRGTKGIGNVDVPVLFANTDGDF